MNIDKLLNKMGLDYNRYTKIEGGTDSVVWQLEDSSGKLYALRILPRERLKQLGQEKQMIQYAAKNKLPVPKVYLVQRVENAAVMLMEWMPGRTVFEAIRAQPNRAESLGYEFARTQITINQVQLEDHVWNNWLVPGSKEEKSILKKISLLDLSKKALLHLDFHPLNVLTDGNKMTGVIDWVNASVGDYRFDVARTLSILRFAEDYFKEQIDPSTIKRFRNAWFEGYNAFDKQLGDLSLFCQWADHRMQRDFKSGSPNSQ